MYYLQRKQSLAEGGLFDGLPREMLYKLINTTYSREIQTIDLFRNSDIHFLAELILHVRPYHAVTGELIYEMGDIATEVSFIIRGSVRITAFGLGGVGGNDCADKDENGAEGNGTGTGTGTEARGVEGVRRQTMKNNSLLGYSSGGGYFGDLEYVKKSTRIARYIALDSCSLVAISYDKLSEAIAKHPDAGNKFLAELKCRYDNFRAVQKDTFNSTPMIVTKSSAPTSAPNLTPYVTLNKSSVSSTYSQYEEAHRPAHPVCLPSTLMPLRSLYDPGATVADNSSVTAAANVSTDIPNLTMRRVSSFDAIRNIVKQSESNSFNTSFSLPLTRPRLFTVGSDQRKTSSDSQSGTLSLPRPRGVSVSSYSNSDHHPSHSVHAHNLKGGDRMGARRQSYLQILTESVYETFEQLNHPHSEYHSNNLRDEGIVGIKVDELWLDGNLLPADSEDFDLNGFRSSSTRKGERGKIKYLVIEKNSDGDEELHECYADTLSDSCMIHPKNKKKLMWDSLIGGLIIYSVIMVPMQMAFLTFESKERGRGLMIFDLCIDLIFFIDILITFNTAYYSESEDAYIAIRSRVISTYLRTWFAVDLTSSIPFNILVELSLSTNHSDLKSLRLIRIIRLLRLVKMMRKINFVKLSYRLEDLFSISPSAMSLITTIIQVVYIAHLICCMWWGLCTSLTTLTWYDSSELVYIPLRDAPFQDQYVASLYWTITTLSTVGYGDIVPINNQERVLAIFIMVVGATVFGYVVANISTVVGNFNQLETKAADRLSEMVEFMKERSCPGSLIKEITTHYQQVFKYNSMFDEEAILARLPVRLRLDLLFVQHKSILEKIPLFQYIKNVSLKLYLLNSMKSKFVGVEKLILKEGEKSEELIFIISGKCLACKILRNASPSPLNSPHASSRTKMNNLSLINKGRFSGKNESKAKGRDRNRDKINEAEREVALVQTYCLWNMKKIGSRWSPRRMEGVGTDMRSSEIMRLSEGRRSSEGRRLSINEYMKDQVMGNIKEHNDGRHKASNGNDNDVGICSPENNNGTYLDDSPSGSTERTRTRNHFFGFSRRLTASANEGHDMSKEKSERAKCNWMRVKSQLARIADMNRLNIDRDISGGCMSNSGMGAVKQKKVIDSMYVLIDVDGHLERIKCNVEPLGTLKSGSFVGHTAMMHNRTYASSLMVTEPCHYYVLHKNDIVRLIRDQPGLAMELQSALSSAIHEEVKEEELKRRKTYKSSFLDDVKEKFYMRKSTIYGKRKYTFARMISSLAKTAKEKEKEKDKEKEKKKEERDRREREEKERKDRSEHEMRTGSLDRVEDTGKVEASVRTDPAGYHRSSTRKTSLDWSSRHKMGKCSVKTTSDIDEKENTIDAINAVECNSNAPWGGDNNLHLSDRLEGEANGTSLSKILGRTLSGKLKSYSNHGDGSVESTVGGGEDDWKAYKKSLSSPNSSTGNSIKVAKRNTFWRGLVETDQSNKHHKLELAEKMLKLDKLQAQYLALVDEYGSDAERVVTLSLRANAGRYSSIDAAGSPSRTTNRKKSSNIIDNEKYLGHDNNANVYNNCGDMRIDSIGDSGHNDKAKNSPNNNGNNHSSSSNNSDQHSDYSINTIRRGALSKIFYNRFNNRDCKVESNRRNGIGNIDTSKDSELNRNISAPLNSSSTSSSSSSSSLSPLDLELQLNPGMYGSRTEETINGTVQSVNSITLRKERTTIRTTNSNSPSRKNSYAERNEINIRSRHNSSMFPIRTTNSTDSLASVSGLKSMVPHLKSFQHTLRQSFSAPVRQVIVNHRKKIVLRKKHRSYADLLDIKSLHTAHETKSLQSQSAYISRGLVNNKTDCELIHDEPLLSLLPSLVSVSVSVSSSLLSSRRGSFGSDGSGSRRRRRRNSFPSTEIDLWRQEISKKQIM